MAHPPTTPTDAARSRAAEPVTSEPSARPATHDTAPPSALLDFMLQRLEAGQRQAAADPAARRRLRRPPSRAVQALPRRDAGRPHRTREGAGQRHLLPLPTRHRLLLPDRQPRARLRAGDGARGRRRPPRRALRRAQPREERLHLLHRPQQGRAVGGPAPRRAAEPGALRRARGARRCPSFRATAGRAPCVRPPARCGCSAGTSPAVDARASRRRRGTRSSPPRSPRCG